MEILNIPHIDELAPDEHVSPDCLEPAKEQALHVLDGVLYVVHGENETVLTPGDSLTIHAGDPRRIWNAGDETVRVVVQGRSCGSDATLTQAVATAA